MDLNVLQFSLEEATREVPQPPISGRLHYLTYTGALISVPVEEISRQCHPAFCNELSALSPPFCHFLQLFHANAKTISSIK